MMAIGRYQIGMQRVGPHKSRRHRPPRLAGALAVASAVALVALAAQAVPAGADNSITSTVTIAVRSVSVSGGPLTYDKCFSDLTSETSAPGLVTPNGLCKTDSSAIVTNGPLPDWIEVSSSPFEPLSPATGPAWNLCSTGIPPSAPELASCSGPTFAAGTATAPGVDEANTMEGGLSLGTQPSCDVNMLPNGCTNGFDASPTDTIEPVMTVIGPESITSPSSSFANTITWLAIPIS
jgi:hypothetical protein